MRIGGRILIVDDDKRFRDITADVLRQDGHECICTATLEQAIARLEKDAIDVVITDIAMRGNTNLEFVEEFWRVSSDVRVIIATEYPTLISAIRAVSLSVFAYLAKPVDIAEFGDTVSRAVIDREISRAGSDALAYRHSDFGALRRLSELVKNKGGDASVEAFSVLTIHNIVNGLRDLDQLMGALLGREHEPHVCHLLQCPKTVALRQALRDAVMTLESTRKQFKSKRLAALRTKLEFVLQADDDHLFSTPSE